MSQTNREIGQWNGGHLLRPIVLLSNQQQVPQMISAECQLFHGMAILEIGSKRKREGGRGDSGGYKKKWKELVHFHQMGPSKSPILLNF